MNKEFSTFADGSDCKECAALERNVEALKQRLAAAEAHEQKTHERLGAILGTDTSLEEAAKRMAERLAAAEAAARWFWREVSCQTVHHSKRQEHEFNEPCPVLQGALKRWPFLGEAAKGVRDE